MRIATFNVNSVRSRLPILERWLPSSGVDALFLQETKVIDSDFPAEPFLKMGYRPHFRGEKSYNGVAAIVRDVKDAPDAEVAFGLGDGAGPDFQTRVMTVRCGGITFLNTYVPQGRDLRHPDFLTKLKFLERVGSVIRKEASGPFVWLGDLNVAPTDIDVAHPENKRSHVCCCEEVRERFMDASRGLIDLLRKFHPEPEQYTFFDYRVKDALKRNIGWRIDHILISPSLSERALDCFIDTEPRGLAKPSDHTPLIADLSNAVK